MAYLLDGAVILLFVAAVIVGYKKGFLGTALNVVGFLAALVLAFLLSAPIANGVYKAVVQPSSEKAIESALADSAGDLTPAESIEKAMDSMPHFVQGLMERKGVTAQTLTNKIGGSVGTAAHDVAVTVTETVAKPVMTLLARCIVFLVLILVLLIVARILEKILGKLLDEFKDEDIKILICPDHPTPLELRTHTNAPVPFMIYDSRKKLDGVDCFCEESAAKTGDYIAEGHTLMSSFLAD